MTKRGVKILDSDRRWRDRSANPANLLAPVRGFDPLLELLPLVGNGPAYEFSTGTVEGSALEQDSIFDTDVVVCRVQFDPRRIRPGELIAVSTPMGLLLRHAYFTLDHRVRLVAANPAYPELVLAAGEITVRGVGAFVVRKLP